MQAMRKMWGGDSLAHRDQDRKKQHIAKTYINTLDPRGWDGTNEGAVLMAASPEGEPNQTLAWTSRRMKLGSDQTLVGLLSCEKKMKGERPSGPTGFNGRCMRCGKIGHKATHCKQNVNTISTSTKTSDAGRAGFQWRAQARRR